MIYFRNDNEEYISWLERHPGEFVLNVYTGGKTKAMLHSSRCGHIYAPDPTLSHTVTYPKACSGDQEELKHWGEEEGLIVTYCPSCRPGSGRAGSEK